MRRDTPYSVCMQEKIDQKISEYGHFSRSALLQNGLKFHQIPHTVPRTCDVEDITLDQLFSIPLRMHPLH